MEFNHFDEKGNAIMVDVTDKSITDRISKAKGTIKVKPEVIKAILGNSVKKGDVLGVSRVAGIMAVKNTSNLIPMCHPLLISKCSVDFEINENNNTIDAYCIVKISGKTGVEMEALTGVTVALLTIYDMCKSIDNSMTISEVYLLEKFGGKSGDYFRNE